MIEKCKLNIVEQITSHLPKKRELLIEHLHLVQDYYHYISKNSMAELANLLNLSLSEVYETASFYHHFKLAEPEQLPDNKTIIQVCSSLACQLEGADNLYDSLSNKYKNKVRVVKVACLGRCQYAPVSLVGENNIDKAGEKQISIALDNEDVKAKEINNYIDYEQYIKQGGYKTLIDCRKNKNALEIINILKDSQLKGLGGAGFPAGLKWQSVYDEVGLKTLAVNIDESEMATFKDRYYLETNPHQFIEGALIASWVIDAKDIYLYLRNEYASARILLKKELEKLKKNPPCDIPNIHLRRGAGAYICGEESAMIESIEGKKGLPRLKPPRISQKGLFGMPTLEHNLETLHWIPEIIKKGVDWYKKQGKEGFSGVRTFSISGRVKNTGTYVVPAGTCLRELIDDYCGGMQDGYKLKAFFVGGSCGWNFTL